MVPTGLILIENMLFVKHKRTINIIQFILGNLR